MSTSAQLSSVSKPYKGPLSYEVEDADYFFGRDREADLLTAKILSSRFTLLHAQSGTGKTSLLNARVLPALERHGWTAFRVLPRQNPSEAVRTGVLLGLLPSPLAEADALGRAVGALYGPSANPTLGELLEKFDHQVSKSDPRRREVLQPVNHRIELKWAALSYTGPLRPLFLRLLRATLETSQYSEHLRTMLPHAPNTEIHEEMPVNELWDILCDPATTIAHEQLLASLYIPVPSLREFFTNLVAIYGKWRTQFSLVLILDQFEELFTLFAESLAAPEKQLWRLRWEFIDNLQQLYEASNELPIRYVISMRDEYIAQLDPVRRFVRDLDASAFHLSFLEKNEARAAIQQPANLFGYDYSQQCYDNIFGVLLREDRFVEPAPLQIVCERLWQDKDRLLAANGKKEAEEPTRSRESEDELTASDQSDKNPAESKPAEESAAGNGNSGETDKEMQLIGIASFPEGGTRKILDNFFDEALSEMSESEQLETLEMLEPLVTLNRTRNIVERQSLVSPPFRKKERRDRLLNMLADKRIVRIEQRLGGQFVEITHEFLITSILDKIQNVLNANPEYSRFRWALRMLERYVDGDFRSASTQLPDKTQFEDLDERAEDLAWNLRGIELMLRSAVARGAGNGRMQYWAERYAQIPVAATAAEILSEKRIRDLGISLLSGDELWYVEAQGTEALNGEQIEFVFRSRLQRSDDSAREKIIYWTKRFQKVCQDETHS